MEKTITFEITESQAKDFEKLLDKFNSTVKSGSDKEQPSDIHKETKLLLSQAKEELEKIKRISANRERMVWECD